MVLACRRAKPLDASTSVTSKGHPCERSTITESRAAVFRHGDDEPPTWRAIIEHMTLIDEADDYRLIRQHPSFI